ncbi:MAG: alpha/beta hydrolase [Candidatus Omnitrophica bacterium]|nr:alpha/beta hydrolase [Candidatus Omnitrophota bacterium]
MSTSWGIKIFTFLKIIFILSIGLFSFTMALFIRNTFLPHWQDKTLPSEYGLPYEEIIFYSRDRFRLKGWLILRDENLPLVILCHGLGTNKSDLLEIAEFIYREGFNVFLFDFRGHGESQGKTSSFGYLEQRDLEGAIDYLYQRKDLENKNLGLFGLSMGGAIAIMVSAKDERIKAVISDSAYKNLYSSMIHLAKSFYHLPKFPSNILLTIVYFLRFGIDPKKISPQNAISQISPRPVFIINGEKDFQIPPENAYSLFEKAKEPKELWIIPGADHGEGYSLYKEEYQHKIVKFLKKIYD